MVQAIPAATWQGPRDRIVPPLALHIRWPAGTHDVKVRYMRSSEAARADGMASHLSRSQLLLCVRAPAPFHWFPCCIRDRRIRPAVGLVCHIASLCSEMFTAPKIRGIPLSRSTPPSPCPYPTSHQPAPRLAPRPGGGGSRHILGLVLLSASILGAHHRGAPSAGPGLPAAPPPLLGPASRTPTTSTAPPKPQACRCRPIQVGQAHHILLVAACAHLALPPQSRGLLVADGP